MRYSALSAAWRWLLPFLKRVQRHWRWSCMTETASNLSPRCNIRLKMHMQVHWYCCYLLHVSQIRIGNSRCPEDVSQGSGLCCLLSSDSDRTAIHELQHIPGAKAVFVVCWHHCSLKLKMELVTSLANDLSQGVLLLLQELLLSCQWSQALTNLLLFRANAAEGVTWSCGLSQCGTGFTTQLQNEKAQLNALENVPC